MKNSDTIFKRLFPAILVLTMFSYAVKGENTPPSAVIITPHTNAYFQQGEDVMIRVYSTDFGGTYPAGSVSKIEFFADDEKIGEETNATDNTYTFTWNDVQTGTYRITAKATDNVDTVSTSAGVIITVGTEPVAPMGLSAGKGKYLGNIIAGNVRTDFSTLWNAVTAENGCKWGSIEATRDVMNWTAADRAYNHAMNNNMVFRYHVIAWGSQYPSWIADLTPSEFQEEVEEYMAAVAERYPLIDQVEVLNENMYINTWNGEEHAAGTPLFREGLGGPGETGYDWVIWLFEKARYYFPNAKLIMNDFELETNVAGLNEMLDVIKVLRDRNLIDGLGTQAHYFNVDGLTPTSLLNALNRMDNGGIPVYVTELDIKGNPASENNQLLNYSRLLPVYWNHPAVAGITLWGYVEGATWSAGTGIINSNGTDRAAITWLKEYMESLPYVGYPYSVDNTSITHVTDSPTIMVYPNPSRGFLMVQNNVNTNIDHIEFYNIQGAKVKEMRILSTHSQIDISDLPKGVYILRIKTAEKYSYQKLTVL